MERIRTLLLAFFVAGLVAAGCSSGDGAAEADVAKPQVSDPGPGDGDDPAGDDAPGGDDDPTVEDDQVDDEPGELTASFRGVTEDAIRIGIVTIDFERLAAIGVDQNRGDTAATYAATIQAINDRGGILGRQLEIIEESYLPTDGAEIDALCTRLTEDAEVFIVVGVIRLDDVLCYTELHETAVISINQMTQERLDRALAPYVTVQGRSDQRAAESVAAMVEAGAFEGETVGVIGFVDADEELYRDTVAALRDAGIEPVEGLVSSTGGDVQANRSAAGVVLERFRTDGVTVTVHASPTAGGLEIAASLGYESDLIQMPFIAPGVLSAAGVDPAYVDGMLSVASTSVGTLDQLALADDPAVVECVATIEERTDEVIDFAIEPEIDNAITALNACGIATILELALTAAGPVLTNESLAAGLAGIGDFALAGFPSASLGPDDFAAAGGGQLVSYSASDGAWVVVG